MFSSMLGIEEEHKKVQDTVSMFVELITSIGKRRT